MGPMLIGLWCYHWERKNAMPVKNTSYTVMKYCDWLPNPSFLVARRSKVTTH